MVEGVNTTALQEMAIKMTSGAQYDQIRNRTVLAVAVNVMDMKYNFGFVPSAIGTLRTMVSQCKESLLVRITARSINQPMSFQYALSIALIIVFSRAPLLLNCIMASMAVAPILSGLFHAHFAGANMFFCGTSIPRRNFLRRLYHVLER